MVLSALADIIYNFYLFLYYVVKTCVYIGYLLSDIVHHVSWLVQHTYSFLSLIYEDNRYFIQDLKSVVTGTAEFFINNISTVYSTSRSIGEKIGHSVAALLNFPNVIVQTIDQVEVQIREAVWFICTLPSQVLDLLLEFMITLAIQVKESAIQWFDSTTAAAYNMMQNMPLKVVCGLGLLLFAYYCPAALLLIIMNNVINRVNSFVLKSVRLANEIKNKVYTFVAETIAAYQLPFEFSYLFSWLYAFVQAQPRDEQPAEPVRRRETPNRSLARLCVICQDNERSVAFIPCGHICACKVCSRILCYHKPVCPLCRAYIRQNLEVYL